MVYYNTAFAFISIHSPLRGETDRVLPARPNIFHFNPLASERRDPRRLTRTSTTLRHFNPLASERRDIAAGRRKPARDISIHSPLRGETTDDCYTPDEIYISIHSPLRGETMRHCAGMRIENHFNPLASERRDFDIVPENKRMKDFNPLASERRDQGHELYQDDVAISIHSPLRGETACAR